MTAFIYRRHVNLLSECDTLYRRSRENAEVLEPKDNPYYQCPYPPYLRGRELFQESHIPEKITVFGIGQLSQDVYNAEVLRDLLDKTVITRSFEEVTGRKPYTPIQHQVVFTPPERALYDRIVNEFVTMKDYFTSTGNLRKDRMLEIIQQLLLMLKACTVPHLFREYTGDEPAKITKLLSMLEDWGQEQVAVGLRHVPAVEAYAKAIQERFPDRPVFVITGDAASLARRKQILKELKATFNGILVCTQQSLSSSVNIGWIDRIVVAELHWNDPAMSQWYFRFIRLDSESAEKALHFLTYRGTIESNLMAMILAKAKLTMFMKGRDVEEEELLERFGIDYNLLGALMYKERDAEGKMKIRWGEQQIA